MWVREKSWRGGTSPGHTGTNDRGSRPESARRRRRGNENEFGRNKHSPGGGLVPPMLPAGAPGCVPLCGTRTWLTPTGRAWPRTAGRMLLACSSRSSRESSSSARTPPVRAPSAAAIRNTTLGAMAVPHRCFCTEEPRATIIKSVAARGFSLARALHICGRFIALKLVRGRSRALSTAPR